MPRSFLYLNAGIVMATLGVLGFLIGTTSQLRTMLPEQIRQRGYQPPLATEIFSTERQPDGTVTHTLLARVYKENREFTPLSQVPRELVAATIAIEDRRFYAHRGISPRDILRAAWVNLLGSRVQQGGSTLTQQLARNIWLSQERTWQRKIREILLALELERNFSKDEILEMYFNEVYYGHGAYGVRTAALTYFKKQPPDLTLPECALLAGLPQRPAGYDPIQHPEVAKTRRADVLEAMLREGLISRHDMVVAKQDTLVHPAAGRAPAGVVINRAPHFSHLVIRNLTQQFGEDMVYGGGLRVYTGLDMRVQEAAQRALDDGVQGLRDSGRVKGGLVGQGALACVDVHDGRVLAMAGGVGPYDQVQFNRAYPGSPVYGRQPGSSFKPYVWTAALESGFGPGSTFSGSALSVPLGGGKTWSPKNYSPNQGGSWSLRNALAQSVNLVSVRVTREVGVDRVRSTAARLMNISADRLDPYLSLALGVSNVSPLEQASGYAVFASGGLRWDRVLVLQIEDHWGRVIYRAPAAPQRVLDPEVANSMISMLRGVVTGGTGTRASAVGYVCGGKTGTTQDGRDAWWVGFTPDLSAAVWVGNDDYTPCPRASGGGFCAPIWARFMRDAMQVLNYNGEFPQGAGAQTTQRTSAAKPKPEKPKPQTVTLCAETGLRATPYCPSTFEKTFAPGDTPPGVCGAHGPSPGSAERPPAAERPGDADHESGGSRTVTVCTESGKLATPFCPNTEERSYARGRAPTGRCTLHHG